MFSACLPGAGYGMEASLAGQDQYSNPVGG